MTFKKTKLVLGIATAIFTLAGAMASPEVLAHSKKAKHSHKKHKSSKTYKSKVAAPAYVAPVAAAPAAAPYDDSALKARIAELEGRPAPVAAPKSKDNMVFFRGGYARSDMMRNGVSINSNANALANLRTERADKDAWYVGAGLDFSIDDNLFGLMNNTEVLGEIMFEYKEFNNRVAGNALTNTGAGVPAMATVSEFTLAASPKIKFMKGSDFRPWILPIGLAINVISPPSESITVLEAGMMFGAGADYRLWKNIYVGVDARYHYALGNVDKVNTDGMTAGGYIGLGF